MRFFARLLVAGVAVSTVAACGGNATTDSSAPNGEASAESFVALTSFPNADYQPLASVQDLGAYADVVVSGTLGNPRAGRSFYGSPDDPYPTFRTVLFDLDDVEVLGGSNPDVIKQDAVLEMMSPSRLLDGDGVAEVKAAMPLNQRGVFFLSVYAPRETTTVKGVDHSLTYLFPLMQGSALDDGQGRLVYVNDPLPGDSGLNFDSTLEGIESSLSTESLD